MRTAEPPLDQVIGRPGLHRLDVHFLVVVAGEHDDRRAAASGYHLAEQIEAGPRSQMVVQQAQPVAAAKSSVSIAAS